MLLSTRPEDYGSSRRQFHAERAAGIAIEGGGTIDGQSTADCADRWRVRQEPAFRTGILLFDDCTNVAVRNVSIRHSDSRTLHFRGCEGVEVDCVEIANNYRRLNSDGIDPNMCRNVRITRCRISAGDDCVVLKTDGRAALRGRARRRLRVRFRSDRDQAQARIARAFPPGPSHELRRAQLADRDRPLCQGRWRHGGHPLFGHPDRNQRADQPVCHAGVCRHRAPAATSRVARIRNVAFENLEIRSRYGALLSETATPEYCSRVRRVVCVVSLRASSKPPCSESTPVRSGDGGFISYCAAIGCIYLKNEDRWLTRSQSCDGIGSVEVGLAQSHGGFVQEPRLKRGDVDLYSGGTSIKLNN